MGVSSDFNKIVHDHLQVHAAWLPVTNTFRVGDFGVISDGVFARMGNIRVDFGVDFAVTPGQPARLDFKSEHVRVIRFTAGAEVNAFPDDPLEAKLRIEFGKERTFYLKSDLNVEAMESVFNAARRLAVQPAWNEGKFKVVSAVYTGTSCVVLSSRKGNAAIELTGKANALKKLELGAAEAGFAFKSSSDLGLEILGETGPVALKLFKVKKKHGEAEFLRGREPAAADLEIVDSEEMGAELEDDI